MKNHNAVEELIRELESKRYEAIIAGDYIAFKAYAHPDLSYAHSTGVDRKSVV